MATIHNTHGVTPSIHDDDLISSDRPWKEQVRLEVELNETTSLAELMESSKRIREMKCVETAILYVDCSFCSWDTVEFQSLWEAIGSLPKLSSLRFGPNSSVSSVRHAPSKVPFQLIQSLLCKSKHLRYLSLRHLCLTHDVDTATTITTADEQRHRQRQRQICPLVAIAKLMETNMNIQELHLDYSYYFRSNTHGRHGLSRTSQQALLQVLQYSNFTLQDFALDLKTRSHFHISCWNKIQFYLALNRTRWRQQLFAEESLSRVMDWLEAVIDCRKNTSIVYFLISSNPSMLLSGCSRK